MEWSLTQNKLLAFHRLMRTDKPIGALLLLWPTLWALWVATPGVPQLWILAVFVAGVWLMRAAGCVVNDYADRKFDGHVKRTANRPLPSGAVTENEARALFVVLVFTFLYRTILSGLFAVPSSQYSVRDVVQADPSQVSGSLLTRFPPISSGVSAAWTNSPTWSPFSNASFITRARCAGWTRWNVMGVCCGSAGAGCVSSWLHAGNNPEMINAKAA